MKTLIFLLVLFGITAITHSHWLDSVVMTILGVAIYMQLNYVMFPPQKDLDDELKELLENEHLQ